ncbi:8-hydroxygeraniol oxidoreductase-like isoform X1 [Dioscorea cayenensis subsp. rotundata]|uniref:8-hydroxygeraniol oxidoreductase-like isoform X1 n=1 Tax=Dioscorea cayennensis subsp. rotundata TaxID=55577 RepID=A0AB40B3C6_DIOCR|nr:8-hydroxygeraniol oxidoreductase-like isoform X1 [Dioscorea cayenensis subsp. rotundata]XP_039121184.1 8-hydroxygeraniol oxidoreductase-like isoform X1 [Dioscorea cayenensis subsp. rotundata]
MCLSKTQNAKMEFFLVVFEIKELGVLYYWVFFWCYLCRVVESVGEGVEELKDGDTVIPALIAECKECLNCSSGRTNKCLKFPVSLSGLMPDQTSRMSVKGQMLYHMFTCSTFCEFMVVNVNFVVKVDPKLPLPHASLLSCGFSTGFGMPWKEAKIEKGSTVAVFGLGGVGTGAIAGAHCMGASKIIGVDLIQNKKQTAYAFGMTDFINPNELDGRSISDAIKDMTGGLGVNYSFDCTGVPSVFNEAIEATLEGTGVTVIVGTPKEPTVPFSPGALIHGVRTLKGSIFGGIKPQSDMPALIAKCVNKEFQLDRMVTHKIALDDINDAFQLIKQPDCLKVCIEINGKSAS